MEIFLLVRSAAYSMKKRQEGADKRQETCQEASQSAAQWGGLDSLSDQRDKEMTHVQATVEWADPASYGPGPSSRKGNWCAFTINQSKYVWLGGNQKRQEKKKTD